MNWYLDVIKTKYATFDGRARRTEFWMFLLFNMIIACVIAFIERIVRSPGILGMIYSLAVLLPGIGVSIRRLHDTGRSGLWLLLGLIPCIGTIVLIVFMAQEGKPGENQYGPNPKGATA